MTGSRRRQVAADERRARLGLRHHLEPGAAATSCDVAAGSLVGLHASDPASVFLAARARVPGLVPTDVEAALYERGSLVKQLCMRRTMFVLPVELIPVVRSACGDAVALAQRRRLVRDVEQGGLAADGRRWLARTEAAALAKLGELREATGAQLSRATPALHGRLTYGEGKRWGGEVGVATRVLTILAAEGRIVRGPPRGGWTSSQHAWRLAPAPDAARPPELEARVELVRRWLGAFGPATEADAAWWTGLGLTRIRQALARIETVEVDLDGEVGHVLPEHEEPVVAGERWVALLPSLDPTTMGWRRRDWYLGGHGPRLFDRNGNAGPTVWADGRIVGGWAQLASGEVVHRLLEDVGAETAEAVAHEAEALTAWLGGTVAPTRFPTPLQQELRG